MSDAYDSFIERAHCCNISHMVSKLDKKTILEQDLTGLIDTFDEDTLPVIIDIMMENMDDQYNTYSVTDKRIFHIMILHMFRDIVEYVK